MYFNLFFLFFFFNDTATTEIYTLSLHDALPISERRDLLPGRRGRLPVRHGPLRRAGHKEPQRLGRQGRPHSPGGIRRRRRSEEHTSELQSRQYLVCRLLLEKKKKKIYRDIRYAH